MNIMQQTCGVSCYMKQTCVVKVPVGKLWESIKDFRWEKLTPSCIKSTKFDSGNSLTLGSQYTLTMSDDTTCTFRIVEISEINRKYTVEMIESSPKKDFSSMLSSWSIEKVTDCTWVDIFCNGFRLRC